MKFSRLVSLLFFVSILLGFNTSFAFADQTAVLLPQSDGFYKQWTTSTGTNHFALVDETTCNGTTDYNYTTTTGAKDSYGINLATVPNGATITQIDITPCASKNTSGGQASILNVFYRYNNIDSIQKGNYSLSGTAPSVLSVSSFLGLSYLKSPSSSFEAGIVFSSGNKGARLGQVATRVTYTPFLAPSSLTASSSSSTQVKLSWIDNSLTETNFVIERATSSAGTWSTIANVSSNTTTYTDIQVNPLTQYYYRVAAINSGGQSAYSNTASVMTYPPIPESPSSLTASISSPTQVVLAWVDNSVYETGFTIERSVSGSNVWSNIKTAAPNSTSYTDTTALPNMRYDYRMYAYNVSGNSAYSNTASVLTPSNTVSAPTNLLVTGITSTFISLSWTDTATNESGFRVERSSSPSGSFELIGFVDSNSTQFSDISIQPNQTYQYRVYAYNAYANSSYSNIVTASTFVPAEPTNLIEVLGSTSATLTWNDNSSNEDGFELQRSDDGLNYYPLTTLAANIVSYFDPAINDGFAFYRIRSFNSFGNSVWHEADGIN